MIDDVKAEESGDDDDRKQDGEEEEGGAPAAASAAAAVTAAASGMGKGHAPPAPAFSSQWAVVDWYAGWASACRADRAPLEALAARLPSVLFLR
jgi:hypothetical protein